MSNLMSGHLGLDGDNALVKGPLGLCLGNQGIHHVAEETEQQLLLLQRHRQQPVQEGADRL